MYRKIFTILLVSVALGAIAPERACTQGSDVITELRIVDGVYDAGLMTWYSPSLFPQCFIAKLQFDDDLFFIESEFSQLVLLGEVITLGLPTRQTQDNSMFTRGRLRVEQIIHCPREHTKMVSEIQIMESDGYEGLQLGDRIILFMIPYEGEYALPTWHCLNSRLGVRLPRPGQHEYFDETGFIKLIEAKLNVPLDSLSVAELRLWARADPCGVAEALIQRREMVRGQP